jgi:regulator of nucleoside diphosphate kinase
MAVRDIFITEDDFEKLSGLLEGTRRRNPRDREHVDRLAAELDRAHVVPLEEMPAGVVRIGSQVAVRDLDTGGSVVFTVVVPAEANVDEGRVSVLAPLGTAVLGYRQGELIEWRVPGRTRRLHIERVADQAVISLESPA